MFPKYLILNVKYQYNNVKVIININIKYQDDLKNEIL